jgi:hypothetical protein
MFERPKKNITIVGTHGRHISQYLHDHLKQRGIRSNAVGMQFRDQNVISKIQAAKTLILMNDEIKQAVADHFDTSSKLVICLDIQVNPSKDDKKVISGEEWQEYHENEVYPKIESQIKKHLKELQ